MNHSNRNKKSRATPEMIVALRGELSQSAVANLWDVNLRTVQRWEAGNNSPSYCEWIGMQQLR